MRIRIGTSRAPVSMLDLHVSGELVNREQNYLQVAAGIRNNGTEPQELQQQGTRCQILAVRKDLTETPIAIFPIFQLRDLIVPGEKVGDLKLCKLPLPLEDMIWVRINLRVVSECVEWNASCVIPVDPARATNPARASSPALSVAHGPLPERRGLTSQIERLKEQQIQQDRRIVPQARARREVTVRPAASQPAPEVFESMSAVE